MKKPIISVHDHGQWQDVIKTIAAVLVANDLMGVEGVGAVAEDIRRRACHLKDGNPLDGTRLWDNS